MIVGAAGWRIGARFLGVWVGLCGFSRGQGGWESEELSCERGLAFVDGLGLEFIDGFNAGTGWWWEGRGDVGGLVSTRLPWECVRCRVGDGGNEQEKECSC
jgi:hypothetical protein